MMDERTQSTIRSVASKLYFITLQVLVFDMLYRLIFLKQDYRDFEDIAIIVTLNALLFVIGVMWKGAISFKSFRYTTMAILYATILVLGSILGVILGRFDSWESYLPYLGRVGGVSAILLAIYAIAAYLGNRRLNKQSEEPSLDDIG